MRHAPDQVSDERLRTALVLAAYIVTRHGPVYAPILDRLEREVAAREVAEDPMRRARRLLEAYTVEGGLKAIR